jgi:microcystin-dependent protein
VNKSPSDAEFNTIGEKYGEKAHTLTVNEMPSHTHIQNAHSDVFAVYSSGTEATGYQLTNGPNGFANRVFVTGNGTVISSTTATNQTAGSSMPENVIQPSIVKVAAIKYTATTGSGSIVSTGTSSPGYWSSAPTGYLAEDGSAVSRTTYANLFSVIGTTYGAGNGSTTFNVPDSRGRISVNISPTDAEFNTMGEKYGEKTHLLTIAEMANHTHTQNAHDHNNGLPSPYVNDGSFGGSAAPSANGTAYGYRLVAQPSATATNQSTGGGQAYNVIQPSIVKLFVIKT